MLQLFHPRDSRDDRVSTFFTIFRDYLLKKLLQLDDLP